MLKIFHLVLTVSLSVITGALAQASFHVGPIPYTMQNVGIVISGLLLPPKYAFLSQLLYLFMIALGLPLSAGMKGGLAVLLGYTGGYLAMFPVASLLISGLSRLYLKARNKPLAEANTRDIIALLAITLVATLPVYLVGFAVFAKYALGDVNLYSWSIKAADFAGLTIENRLALLFFASVVIFLPQDLLMDNLIGIVISKNLVNFFESRGLKVE